MSCVTTLLNLQPFSNNKFSTHAHRNSPKKYGKPIHSMVYATTVTAWGRRAVGMRVGYTHTHHGPLHGRFTAAAGVGWVGAPGVASGMMLKVGVDTI